MKKLVSLLLATMLILSCLAGVTFAADAEVSYTAAGVTKEGTVAEATKAIIEAKGGEIKLLKDLTFKDPDGDPTKGSTTYGLAISQKVGVTIDLNGHTIHSEGVGIRVGVYEEYGTGDFDVIIKNGTIVSHKQSIGVCNGGLQLENVKAYSKANQVIDFYDYSGARNATNRIENCTLISGAWGAFCFQKGAAEITSNATSMTIRNSVLANAVGTDAIVANAAGAPTVVLGEGVQLMTLKVKDTSPIVAKITVTGEALTKSADLGSATVADKSVGNLNLWTTPATATKPAEAPAAPAQPAGPEAEYTAGGVTKQGTMAEAVAAVNKAQGGSVKMLRDYHHTDAKVKAALSFTAPVVFDLNGFAFTSVTLGIWNTGKTAVGVTAIIDSVGTGYMDCERICIGAEKGGLYMNGVKAYTKTQQTVAVYETSADWNDKNLIENCVLVTDVWGTIAFNNTEASMADYKLTIKNSTIANTAANGGKALVVQAKAVESNVEFGEGVKLLNSKGGTITTLVDARLMPTGERPTEAAAEIVTVGSHTTGSLACFATKAPAEAPTNVGKLADWAAIGTAAPAEKPAETPAEKPAEAPAEKPAEKPTEKPAEKPAEQDALTGIVVETGTSEGGSMGLIIAIVAAVAVVAVVVVVVLKKKKK